MSEAPTKAPAKRKVERYTFDDDVVELRQVEPDRREAPPGDFMAGPATRSKWEIYVNGKHLGYAFYPRGYNGSWVVTSLEPQQLDPLYGEVVHCWEPPTGEHGGWKQTGGMWDGLKGLLKPLHPYREGTTWNETSHKWLDRPQIAKDFLRCFKQGQTPDPAGVLAKVAKVEQERERRAREDAERRAQWARDAEETKARQAREATEREEARQETLAGLESIRERMGRELSNLESVALGRAIDAYTKR